MDGPLGWFSVLLTLALAVVWPLKVRHLDPHIVRLSERLIQLPASWPTQIRWLLLQTTVQVSKALPVFLVVWLAVWLALGASKPTYTMTTLRHELGPVDRTVLYNLIEHKTNLLEPAPNQDLLFQDIPDAFVESWVAYMEDDTRRIEGELNHLAHTSLVRLQKYGLIGNIHTPPDESPTAKPSKLGKRVISTILGDES